MFKSYTVSLVVSVACVADIIYCRLVASAKPCQYSGLPIPMCFDIPFNNGIFNRPIIAHMQVLVYRWARGCPQPGFQCCLTGGLNQNFSSVCGTG